MGRVIGMEATGQALMWLGVSWRDSEGGEIGETSPGVCA